MVVIMLFDDKLDLYFEMDGARVPNVNIFGDRHTLVDVGKLIGRVMKYAAYDPNGWMHHCSSLGDIMKQRYV